METYACDLDFQYTLQQGVKFKEIASVCSGSSGQSNDDVIDKLGNHKFSLKTAEGIELECEVAAVLLEDSKSLSEEVLTSSLKCEAVEADCITVEGEVFPAQCVIPFNHNGRRYLGCTDRPGSTKLWCPTKTDETGEAEANHWGFCSKKCGYCGGSPITTRAEQEESCGYDCLVGADWDMVGYDKAPLLQPMIDVSLPKESNYIAEKGGQHQLNIGSQSVTISCPETKFYDPALRQQTSVNVVCGPQKYRLTVTTQSGATLGENFKNDQFGCDPCPSSYSYVPGFLTTGDFSSNGIFYDVKTVQDCKTLCEESCHCQTFDYSKQQSRCQLIKELIIKPSFSSSIGDYVLCAKGEDDNLCGTNNGLLVAEKNWPYLSQALNQTGHLNPAYRTNVFEVVTENGDIVMTSTNCPVSDTGLVSLFIAPSTVQCSAATLGDSSTNGLHHLMVSTSCDLDTAIQKFISDKDKFKQYFNSVPMKLCGARTWMKSVVAESRKTTLIDVFSFLYNTAATADSFDLDDASNCKKREDTAKTLTTMFSADNVGFISKTYSGTEEDGLVEVHLERTLSTKIGIAFVETQFESEQNSDTADDNDIVPYSGLVTFPANSNSGSIFITIIKDNVTETDEDFEIVLMYSSKRMMNVAAVVVARQQPPVQLPPAGGLPLTTYTARHPLFQQLARFATICFPPPYLGNTAFFIDFQQGQGQQALQAMQLRMQTFQNQTQTNGFNQPPCTTNGALGIRLQQPHAEIVLLQRMHTIAQANPNREFYLYTHNSPCPEGHGSCQEAILNTVRLNPNHLWFVGFNRWYNINTQIYGRQMTCPEKYLRWCANMIFKRTGRWTETGKAGYIVQLVGGTTIYRPIIPAQLQFVWFNNNEGTCNNLLNNNALQHHRGGVFGGVYGDC